MPPKSSSDLSKKSPAEFFAENKHFAGFDNPGKSLFTSLRELVENGLDAAEIIEELPCVKVDILELGKESSKKLLGTHLHKRKDKTMYRDEDTDKPKTKKGDKTVSESTSEKEEKPSSRGYYRVIVRDNGCGMPHEKIPDMLGRVLSGTKYGVKQTRGKFGLGSKMVLIWSKMTTGEPVRIKSSRPSSSTVSECILDLDLRGNAPKILKHTRSANTTGFTGTEIEVKIEGAWSSYRSQILRYFSQLAVITPHAEFILSYSNEDQPERAFTKVFERRAFDLPPLAQHIKPHPLSVNNIILEHMIHDTTAKTLKSFLTKEFSAITSSFAERLITELGPTFEEDMDPKELNKKHINNLVSMMKAIKVDPPNASCLSPAGEYNLLLGILKEIGPDSVATATAPPGSYEGHPFIVEAAVSIGGNDRVKPGLNIYRFANRIPLLFQLGADVVNKVVQKKIKWPSYRMNPAQQRVGVFVSIVSTKIPFADTGKECIKEDVEELHSAIRSAIASCCLQLKVKIERARRDREKKDRRKALLKYAPDVARAVHHVLQVVASSRQNLDERERGLTLAKRRHLVSGEVDEGEGVGEKVQAAETGARVTSNWDDEKVIEGVRDGSLTEGALVKNLTDFVEMTDFEMALEAHSGKNVDESRKDHFRIQPMVFPPSQLLPSEANGKTPDGETQQETAEAVVEVGKKRKFEKPLGPAEEMAWDGFFTDGQRFALRLLKGAMIGV